MFNLKDAHLDNKWLNMMMLNSFLLFSVITDLCKSILLFMVHYFKLFQINSSVQNNHIPYSHLAKQLTNVNHLPPLLKQYKILQDRDYKLLTQGLMPNQSEIISQKNLNKYPQEKLVGLEYGASDGFVEWLNPFERNCFNPNISNAPNIKPTAHTETLPAVDVLR